MAEEEGLGGEQQTNGADNQPQAGIISQYVKDLSFENPTEPATSVLDLAPVRPEASCLVYE